LAVPYSNVQGLALLVKSLVPGENEIKNEAIVEATYTLNGNKTELK
jgi:hypothetical protein